MAPEVMLRYDAALLSLFHPLTARKIDAMRAIIIGAGRGSRLMPTTADSPKCFAEVGGMRILDWALEAFRQNGVTDVAFIDLQSRRRIEVFPIGVEIHDACSQQVAASRPGDRRSWPAYLGLAPQAMHRTPLPRLADPRQRRTYNTLCKMLVSQGRTPRTGLLASVFHRGGRGKAPR